MKGLNPTDFRSKLSGPNEHRDLRHQVETVLKTKVAMLRELNVKPAPIGELAVSHVVKRREDVSGSSIRTV